MGTSLVMSVILPEVYGRKALGSVNGIVLGVATAASGFGPLLFGLCRDMTGSYDNVQRTLFIVYCIVVPVLWLSPLPTPPRRAGPVSDRVASLY